MPRVISLFLPTWPTDRLRRKLGAEAPHSDGPLVLVGREGPRRVVFAANGAASALGLRPGMPATKALALVPGLVIKDADPAGDLDALERLAVWALQRYAPIVAPDPPDGLIIDATGAAHLHGGEKTMITDIVARITSSGVGICAAMADSWGAAHAFARYDARPTRVIPEGQSARVVMSLPIAALRLPYHLIASLGRLGFETIEDLASKPRGPLHLRFGADLGRRLDQALGLVHEPINPVSLPELISVRRAFAEPIAASETLARYTSKLVVQLCTLLETKGLGARKLDLLFHRVDNSLQFIRVGTALPCRNVKQLTRLLSDKIETIDPGFGVEAMALSVPFAEPIKAKQNVSSLIEEAENDISSLIDTLSNRIGENNLYRMEPVASDVPERSVRRVAPAAPKNNETWPNHWPRPSRLLPAPEPIETMALLPDHPPVHFTWRGIRRRVKRADGPERVFGEWWKSDPELTAVRDYFQVEDETGERFWIYRSGDGEDPTTGSHRWFLHGIFG